MDSPDEPTDRQRARRAQLEGWIAWSRQVQHRLRLVMLVGAVLAIASSFIARWIGVSLLLVTAAVGLVGYWVTAAHIADWRQQLDRLAQFGRAR